jgi:hypothetical protein
MPKMEAKKKTGMFDKRSMQLGSVDEENEDLSIMGSDVISPSDQAKKAKMQEPEEPKIFRDKKGHEMVMDAKRLNSMKRPNDKAVKGRSVVVAGGEKSEKSMEDESFSDDNIEETKHDT